MMNSKLFYKGMSKIYDLLDILYFRKEAGSPRTALKDYIEAEDKQILDICTGTAANAIAIAKSKKNSQITGIDLSDPMLLIARNKVTRKGLSNIKLYNMDAVNTTFKDHTFDVAILSLVLHEISKELARSILLEAKRLIKPEGKLLIIEWEEPRSIGKKILFYPIKMLEPTGFNEFLKMDMKQYFGKFELEITDMKQCDYSKVFYVKNRT